MGKAIDEAQKIAARLSKGNEVVALQGLGGQKRRREAPSQREPDLLNMADVETAEIPWLWPGRIPIGRLTLLAGRPGGGKSFLTVDIASRVSTGAQWPDGGYAPEGQTLLIAAEDDPADTIKPRLVGAGADCSKVSLLRAEKIIRSDNQESTIAFDLTNIVLIRATLDRMADCRLVIVDPIGSYLGGDTDTYRDNEVRAVLGPLAALAAERKVAVLLIAHTRKAGAIHADDSVLGARAFTGLARVVLHLDKDPDDRNRKLLLPGKCNLQRESSGLAYRIVGEPARLEWESDPVEMNADDLAGAQQRHGPAPNARDSATEWLKELLALKPMPAADIKDQARDAGFSLGTIRRAQETIGIKPFKQNFQGPWLWELPKMLKQPMNKKT